MSIFDLDYEGAKNFVERYRNRSATPESKSSRKTSESESRRKRKKKSKKKKSKSSHKKDQKEKLNPKTNKLDLFSLEKGAKKLMNEFKIMESALKSEIEGSKDLSKDSKLKELEEKINKATKQAAEAHRDDLTIMVHNIPIKATESEIYSFFSTAKTGKIRDIRIIRDPKSGKSKGAAYVEFYTNESVLEALGLSEIPHKGWTLKIYPSQAEKNRAHVASKTLKSANNEISMLAAPPAMVYIDGLYGELKPITDEDLKYLFSSFGEIQDVRIERDEEGFPLGFASMQYSSLKEARKAVEIMHGFYVNSQKISVSLQPLTAKQAEILKRQIDFDVN